MASATTSQIVTGKLDWYRINLMRQTYFIPQDIDGILHYLHEYYREVRPRVPAGFTKNLLRALKAINQFAKEKAIRFDDAVIVLHDYATTESVEEPEAE
jgi:hypothetical protein